jgi:hypothetical protein
MSESGTLLPRANAAACPQLAKADFACQRERVREGQRIAALDAEVDALRRQALARGAEPTADVPARGFTRSEDRCAPRARGMKAMSNEFVCSSLAGRTGNLLLSWTNVRIRRKETCGR